MTTRTPIPLQPLLVPPADDDAHASLGTFSTAAEPVLGRHRKPLINKTMLGLFIYALSTLFTTLMAITAKLAGANGMPVMVITFVRGAVVLIFSIPPLIIERANPIGNRVGLLLVRGVLGWASGATLYASVQYLPISDATVLSFLSPVWVALTSPLLIKESPSRYEERR